MTTSDTGVLLDGFTTMRKRRRRGNNGGGDELG
jgi:hypothetical protein